MAVADRAILRAATVQHCGRDPMRVVRRTRRVATLAELLVGATQHSAPANRRFQDFQQKPFSELDHRTTGTLRNRSQHGTACYLRSADVERSLSSSHPT